MFKKTITLLVLMAFVLGMVVVAGCGQKAAEGDKNAGEGSEKLYVGWVGPLTGPCADNGQQMRKGAELAVKEINAAGGINGKQVELIAQDDKSDPKEAANIATKYASDDRLLAVLGNYNSSAVLAGAPIYNEAKIVMIPLGTSPVISVEHGPYLFRYSCTDEIQGKFVVKWMFDEGQKNVAILYENNDYGRGLLSTVEKEVVNLGGKVVLKESYMLGETKDFTGIITKLKASKADALFLASTYNESALIAKQMKQLGVKLPSYGPDSIYEQALIDLGGDAVEGIKVSGLLLPTDPDAKVSEFVKNYNASYGANPGTYGALHYDAMKLLAKIITEVGPDREKIKDYLTNIPEPYDGVTGKVTFDQNHDSQRETLKKLVVKDSKWQVAE